MSWLLRKRAEPAPAAPTVEPAAEIPLAELGRDAIDAVLSDPEAKPEARVAGAKAVLDAASDADSHLRPLVPKALATLREVLTPGGPASLTAVVSAAKAATVEPPGEMEPRIGLLGIVEKMPSNADDRPAKARPPELAPAGSLESASWWDRIFTEIDEGRTALDARAAKDEAAGDSPSKTDRVGHGAEGSQ